MESLRWLEEVRGRLARSGLPPSYIQRFMEELTDHFEDLKEENMSTEAGVELRLGEPEQVAETAVVAYRRRSFLGRHPAAAFAVFAVSPVILMGVLAASFVFLLVGGWYLVSGELCTDDYIRCLSPDGAVAIKFGLTGWIIILPSVFASIFYCKLAKWSGVTRNWMFFSCVILAAVVSVGVCSVKVSNMPGESGLMFGLAIPQHLRDVPRYVTGTFHPSDRLFQFLVPLVVCLWFMRRKTNEQRTTVTPGTVCKAA